MTQTIPGSDLVILTLEGYTTLLGMIADLEEEISSLKRWTDWEGNDAS